MLNVEGYSLKKINIELYLRIFPYTYKIFQNHQFLFPKTYICVYVLFIHLKKKHKNAMSANIKWGWGRKKDNFFYVLAKD